MVDDEKPSFDWSMVFNMVGCLLLGMALFLFVRNNALLAHGGRNLWHADALVILGLVGFPFGMMLLQIVRHVIRSR